MANEYRVTTAALEVLADSDPDLAALLTSAALEALQVDDPVTDIKVTVSSLEVLRSIADAAPGTLRELGLNVTAGGFFAVDLSPGTGLRLALRGEGRFSFSLDAANFVCEVAEVTTWTRGTPAGPSWSRVSPQTTNWICADDVVADTGIETLDYVDGTELLFLDDDALKLIG